MPPLAIDRKAQGVAQPFAEPPTTVRDALPALDKALIKRDELIDRQTKLWLEVEQLRGALHTDRERDREARAAAAEAGESSPPSIAEATEALIAEKTSLAIALVDRIDQEQQRAHEIIMRERDKWSRDLEHRTIEHVVQYSAVILGLDQARTAVVDDVTAKAWLTHYPDAGPMPDVHHLPQPPELADQPKPSWTHIRDYLRRDAEALPNIAGVPIDTHRALALYNHGAGFQATTGGGRRRIR